MEKIKNFYFEISSKDYGKLYSLGWMLLSSLIISIIVLEGLMIAGGPGSTFDFSDVLDYLITLLVAPLFSLCIVGVRLLIKVLNTVLVFLDSLIIKAIIYVGSIVVMITAFGAVLGDSTFLPESESLQYIFMGVFDLIYIAIIILCYKTKNRYIEKH